MFNFEATKYRSVECSKGHVLICVSMLMVI